MRLLVCGSRTFDDVTIAHALLDGLTPPDIELPAFCLIEGGAQGADRIASNWAEARRVAHDRYNAEWDKRGKAAGPLRNIKMLDEGKPDMVVAFIDKPLVESRGTADMVSRASVAGLPVYVVEKIN